MIAATGFAARGECLSSCHVFVLAGGLGTRIRPVLGDVPKILAPIAGRPYLEFVVDWLQRFGARRIVLGLGYRSEAVIAYLRGRPARDVEIETIVEPHPLGTAGAIRFARARLRTDPVLIINGDSFVDADLCEFHAYHAAGTAAGTVLCTEVMDSRRYGRVEIDERQYIRAFIEKDPNFRGPALINAGIYLLSARLLDSIAQGQAASLEKEVFEQLPAASLSAFCGRFNFIDIGTPESLEQAAGVLYGRPHAFLPQDRQ